MLSYTDLKKGVVFVRDGEPFEVLDSNFSRMQQRKAVIQAKIRNLITGKVTDTTFQASDQYEEANIEKRPLKYLYGHRGEFVFLDPSDPKKRITLSNQLLGDAKKWLLPDTEIIALMFDEKIIKFNLPIKMDIKVIEAPPGVQGDRAQSGSKAVTLETGAIIQVPLFINTDDIVRVNTETGEYVERTEKA
jgi:elongation factor P